MSLAHIKQKTIEAAQVLHEVEASMDLASQAEDMANVLTHLDHATVASGMLLDSLVALLEEAKQVAQH